MRMDKEQVRKLVPPYVFQTKGEFGYCSLCQRCYWKGTHWEAMVKKIEEILGKKG